MRLIPIPLKKNLDYGEVVSPRRRIRERARIVTREAREILALRVSGISSEEIAERLGLSLSLVEKYLYDLLSRFGADHETLDEIRRLEHARYESLLRAYWDRAIDGEKESLAAVIQILKRIDSLFFGKEISLSFGSRTNAARALSPEERSREIERLLEAREKIATKTESEATEQNEDEKKEDRED